MRQAGRPEPQGQRPKPPQLQSTAPEMTGSAGPSPPAIHRRRGHGGQSQPPRRPPQRDRWPTKTGHPSSQNPAPAGACRCGEPSPSGPAGGRPGRSAAAARSRSRAANRGGVQRCGSGAPDAWRGGGPAPGRSGRCSARPHRPGADGATTTTQALATRCRPFKPPNRPARPPPGRPPVRTIAGWHPGRRRCSPPGADAASGHKPPPRRPPPARCRPGAAA